MNKEIFLDELRGYLQILEDQEQEDILEEYSQHIDMKMKKGLSEEEAISDFGPVKALAADILEAYHVKPEFQKKTALAKLPGIGGGTKGSVKKFIKRIGYLLKEKFSAVRYSIRKGCEWTGKKCRAFINWIVRLFGKKKDGKTALLKSEELEIQQGSGVTEEFGGKNETALISGSRKGNWKKQKRENTERGSGKMRSFFEMTGRALAALWRMFLGFCIWWLRLLWNMAWLMFSVFCAAMAMIVILGVGTMIIFQIMGYPVLGLLIICIGGLLCFAALSMGAFSLLIRKKKEEPKQETEKDMEEQSGEEVQYE